MGRLLAISDIHGCFETFRTLVTDKLHLTRSDKLMLLGDYIDRGEKSRQVIDFIMDLIASGYDVTPLSGNHELMLLEAFRSDDMLPLWLINDGLTTMYSFEVRNITELENKYLNFFRNLKYYESVGDFLFVHAGFNDIASDPFTDIHGMVWESHGGYSNPLLSNRTIIHGHRPKSIEFVLKLLKGKSRVIPIDTGCVYSKEEGYGHLSALDVGEMRLISIENLLD